MDTTLCDITNENLDLLDRQEFVNKMLTIVEALSNNKKNACYAINGTWGVGKSFVLNMFEEQTKDTGSEGEELPKYLVFRYNCWEYDYYDEPLIAIVASMLDQISKNENLIPEEMRSKFVEVLKILGAGLVDKAIQIAKETTGIPFDKVINCIQDGFSSSSESIKDANAYDQYFEFKKILVQLQETIKKLAEYQTLIFIVDELDRCLPEYTIKVLERLHHLFNEIPNVQVILAIDKGQIAHIVKQIYGCETNVNRYLAKFINFELKLAEGSFDNQAKFNKQFEQYTNCFLSQTSLVKDGDIAEFESIVLAGIDMRGRIGIIDKCQLIHNMLYEERKEMDPVFMCIEIFLTIIIYVGIDINQSAANFSTRSLFIMPNDEQVLAGLQLITAKYNIPHSPLKYIDSCDGVKLVRTSNIWGILLAVYRYILGFEDDCFMYGFVEENIIRSFSKKFWELLQIIS